MQNQDAPALPDGLVAAVLGTGSMGSAILAGLTAGGLRGIRATTRTAQGARRLDAMPGVRAFVREDDPEANRAAVRGAGLVVVAVKPAGVVAVLAEIADALDDGALVVSVAAGVTTAAMEAVLPPTAAVVRAMPNTPAFVRRGVTGLCAGARAGTAAIALAQAVFALVGTVVVVPESRIDALTSISGSGPAYVFYLIEQFTAAAVAKGFAPEQAALLAQGTFLGAVELLESADASPAELRRQVTSPGGTTAAALEVFAGADVEGLFARATDAALARARELGA